MKLAKIESVGIYNSKNIAADGKLTKKRICSMFEIELPIDAGGISYVETDHSEIKRDMIICAKPGQARHTKFPFKCYYIHMILNEGYLYECLKGLPDFLKITDREAYEEIFLKLLDYYGRYTKRDEIRLQSLVLELIHRLACDGDGQKSGMGIGSTPHYSIERAIEYIKAHLTEELSLSSVAEWVSLNPIYFHNLFKKALGKTLHDYIEEQRIKKAIHLLLTTELTLTEIAYDCGFSSQSYFSFVFKRRMNTTPRKYVQKINAGYGK